MLKRQITDEKRPSETSLEKIECKFESELNPFMT